MTLESILNYVLVAVAVAFVAKWGGNLKIPLPKMPVEFGLPEKASLVDMLREFAEQEAKRKQEKEELQKLLKQLMEGQV